MSSKEKFQKAFTASEVGGVHYPDSNTRVVRVPNGWVWSDMSGTCFIPLHG
jgi:hypothetical protein